MLPPSLVWSIMVVVLGILFELCWLFRLSIGFYNDSWAVFAVMPANTQIREPVGDRIRINGAQKKSKTVIFRSSAKHKQAINNSLVASGYDLRGCVSTDRCRSNVAVVEPTQDWRRCNLSPRLTCWPRVIFSEVFWDLLSDALIRSGVVVIIDIFLHDAIQLARI